MSVTMIQNTYDADTPVWYDEVDAITQYESGLLDEDEERELFEHLIDNGHIWHLQGSYVRQAERLGLI